MNQTVESIGQIEDVLSLSRLEEMGAFSPQYQNAQPFPHIEFDDFLVPHVAERLHADFPGPHDHEWLRYEAAFENDKLQSTNELSMPRSIREAFAIFNSSTFVRFLERLTGIEGIVPDPHLYGGGMHQTIRGGHLGVHVDYNRHERWNLDRRLNVLLYLNKSWDENWGGALELWDVEVKNCVKRIYPVMNRLVIFSTTEFSWHGHPNPLACPEGTTRKSIALYYYTNGRPEREIAPIHSTIFKEVDTNRFWSKAKRVLRDITPPIISRTIRRALYR